MCAPHWYQDVPFPQTILNKCFPYSLQLPPELKSLQNKTGPAYREVWSGSQAGLKEEMKLPTAQPPV